MESLLQLAKVCQRSAEKCPQRPPCSIVAAVACWYHLTERLDVEVLEHPLDPEEGEVVFSRFHIILRDGDEVIHQILNSCRQLAFMANVALDVFKRKNLNLATYLPVDIFSIHKHTGSFMGEDTRARPFTCIHSALNPKSQGVDLLEGCLSIFRDVRCSPKIVSTLRPLTPGIAGLVRNGFHVLITRLPNQPTISQGASSTSPDFWEPLADVAPGEQKTDEELLRQAMGLSPEPPAPAPDPNLVVWESHMDMFSVVSACCDMLASKSPNELGVCTITEFERSILHYCLTLCMKK